MLQEQVKKEPANGSDEGVRRTQDRKSRTRFTTRSSSVWWTPKCCLPPRSAGSSRRKRSKRYSKRPPGRCRGYRRRHRTSIATTPSKRRISTNCWRAASRRASAKRPTRPPTRSSSASSIRRKCRSSRRRPISPSCCPACSLAAIGAAVALPFLLFQFDRSYTTLTALRALGVPVLGSVSHLVFPDGQRRERIQLAAVCASIVGLLCVYGLLLAISANMYRLSFA